ncbi:MAG: glycosyltransferase family 4 protein [Solirubrobacterales bacterium]
MRIAIVNNQAPFVRGGAELLAEWLQSKLQQHGHEAELVRIPFQWNPAERIVDHMLAARLVRIERADRVIAFKFPAYYVPHDDKVLWLLHQFRQAYDLWGTPFQGIPDTPAGHRIREAIVAADRTYLKEVSHIYTNSKVVAHRLRTYSGLDAEPLFPPLLDASPFRSEGYGDYFFFPSRINAVKRQHLAAEAMAQVPSSTRLVIAGPPDTPGDLARLREVIAAHGLEHRVEVIPRWISEEEKIELLAGARGVIYIPLGEDSYGYVTLEAFHASKPVITLADSEGTLELIADRHNGLVAAGLRELADAIDELAVDRGLAERMGENAKETIAELDISWDRVVRCLAG